MDPADVEEEVAAVTRHWAYEPLFKAWCAAHDRAAIDHLLSALREPGPIALRCRFRHLLDPGRPDIAEGALVLGRDQWEQLLSRETRADALLRMGPQEQQQARSAFEALAALEYQPAHRVVTVNALHGLADVARHVDDRDAALRLLREAATISEQDGYRFGRARALVSLGYLISTVSVTAAAEHFTEAAALARQVGDRLYRANAELGLAETNQRLHELHVARHHAAQALAVFETLNSPMGIGNAASRLADVLLHRGERAQARQLLQRAASAFGDAGAMIGQVSTLDLLGDVAVDDGDVKAATAHHRRAYELSTTIAYPRGQANALAGLAAAARAAGVWPQARQLGGAALTAFRELGDPLGEANALEGLALCAVGEGDLAEAVQPRFAAVRTIEAMRADLNRHDLQAEYRSRFEPTYRRAALTALDAGDAAALAWLLECLAGRRLAGLVERAATRLDPSRAELLAELTARADLSWRSPEPDSWHDKRSRIVRKISAMAIKSTLGEPATQALEDMIANLYLPPPEQLDPLVEALPGGCEMLMIEIGLCGVDAAVWVLRDQDGGLECGLRQADGLDALLDQLDGAAASQLTITDLAPLRAVLPDQLTDRLATGSGHRLLIIPIGPARRIPWTAVPLTPNAQVVLGEAARVAVCPSLTVQRALRARRQARPPWPPRPSVGLWRNPSIGLHPLNLFDGDPDVLLHRLPDARAALSAMRQMQHDLLVVAAHGRPTPGGGHYLELDEQTVIVQADCIGARPPRKVALVACWGGHTPGAAQDSDPVSIAALLLASGSDEVIATTAELGDSGQATRLVDMVLDALRRDDAPTAIHRGVARLLRDPGVRKGSVRHWAPLQSYGTFNDSTEQNERD